jgi:hypothetical protein
MKLDGNMTVLFLFFGLALISSIQESNWILAELFLTIGFISLFADNIKKET